MLERQVNRNIGDSPRQLPSQCLAIKVDDEEEGEVMTQFYHILMHRIEEKYILEFFLK